MCTQLDLFDQVYQESEEKVTDKDLQKLHDKKYKEEKLTPREWRLLDLIKHNSFVEHRKTTQKEICEKIDTFIWNDDEKCHDHCTAIWHDIEEINLSYQTDKLIISDKFDYWIGDEEETKAFIDKKWQDLLPRLVRYWAFLNKVKRNGQGILIDRKGNVIDEDSQARAFIENYGNQRIS